MSPGNPFISGSKG